MLITACIHVLLELASYCDVLHLVLFYQDQTMEPKNSPGVLLEKGICSKCSRWLLHSMNSEYYFLVFLASV